MVRDELVDALLEFFDTGERAAANCLIGGQREDAFNLVQPGSVDLNEVRVPTRPGQARASTFLWPSLPGSHQ
jgi:hypothetical protein